MYTIRIVNFVKKKKNLFTMPKTDYKKHNYNFNY